MSNKKRRNNKAVFRKFAATAATTTLLVGPLAPAANVLADTIDTTDAEIPTEQVEETPAPAEVPEDVVLPEAPVVDETPAVEAPVAEAPPVELPQVSTDFVAPDPADAPVDIAPTSFATGISRNVGDGNTTITRAELPTLNFGANIYRVSTIATVVGHNSIESVPITRSGLASANLFTSMDISSLLSTAGEYTLTFTYYNYIWSTTPQTATITLTVSDVFEANVTAKNQQMTLGDAKEMTFDSDTLKELFSPEVNFTKNGEEEEFDVVYSLNGSYENIENAGGYALQATVTSNGFEQEFADVATLTVVDMTAQNATVVWNSGLFEKLDSNNSKAIRKLFNVQETVPSALTLVDFDSDNLVVGDNKVTIQADFGAEDIVTREVTLTILDYAWMGDIDAKVALLDTVSGATGAGLLDKMTSLFNPSAYVYPELKTLK